MATWEIIPLEGTRQSVTADSIEASPDGSTIKFSTRAPGLGSILTVALLRTTPGMLVLNVDSKPK